MPSRLSVSLMQPISALRMTSSHFTIGVTAILALTLAVTPAQAKWKKTAGSPFANFRFEDVFFLDAENGYVVELEGRLYRTTDGGDSFEIVPNVPGAGYRSVAFSSPERGTIGTLVAGAPLIQTLDGGETWNVVPGLSPTVQGICGLWVINENVLYGTGMYSGAPCVIRSWNGGRNWHRLDLWEHASALIDCHFASPSTGIVVGGIGSDLTNPRAIVLRTTDGGGTWQTRHLGSRQGEWCWKISFVNSEVGFISMESVHHGQRVLRTRNGGLDWTEMPSVANVRQQGIGFLDERTGWVGGWNGTTSRTTDGGETWTSDPWGSNVNSFFRVSPDLAYAVGRYVYKYERPPFPEDAFAAAVGAVSEGSVFGASVLGNPFRTSTSIAYRLDAAMPVQLSIFSLSGQRLERLVDGWQDAGEYQVSWDAVNPQSVRLEPGVYFYRLDAGPRRAVGKLQLIR